jgi:hypothetical protein
MQADEPGLHAPEEEPEVSMMDDVRGILQSPSGHHLRIVLKKLS